MRTVKIGEAAALLDVSPQTLRGWERRFGYPTPHRSPGGHRLYIYRDVAVLRTALQQGLSIASAVRRARAATTDTPTLVAGLAALDLERADSAMELVLGLHSVERAVEEVLLPSVDAIGERYGGDSAQSAFAARWADCWLRRAQRCAPPAANRLAILVGDATRDALDPDARATRALELFCARSGARVLTLPVSAISRLADVVASLSPDAAVIAGGHAPEDVAALWARRVGASTGPLPMALFRRSPDGARTTLSTRAVGDAPFRAHRQLLALIDQHRSGDGAALSARQDDRPRQLRRPRAG